MIIQPRCISAAYHATSPGKIVGIPGLNGIARVGLTVEPVHGGSGADVVLLPSQQPDPSTDYAVWDGTEFEAGPALIFEDYVIDLNTDQGVDYDKNQKLFEGRIYLTNNRLALASVFPQQGTKVCLLHWLDTGLRARPQLSTTVSFSKWSILAQLTDASPRAIFTTP